MIAQAPEPRPSPCLVHLEHEGLGVIGSAQVSALPLRTHTSARTQSSVAQIACHDVTAQMGTQIKASIAAAQPDVIQLRGGSTVRMLHEPLGHGSLGRVSKGRLRIGATGRPVAVKEFRLEDKAAYDRELLAMKRWVGNPNILNLIVSGEDVVIGDLLIIVTKMFFGDLCSYFDDRTHPGGWGTLPFGDVDVSLMQDISSALQLMADKGLVHRDVKPSNILIDKKEEGGKLHYRAVLGGLGQSVHVGSKEALGAAGTPLYRAPETLDASRPQYSEQSDKYSFGIVLYSTIGRKEIEISDFLTDPDSAHPGADEAEVVLMKGLRPQIPSEVPGILKSILQQCWKQIPAERGSFKQLTAELQLAYEATCELSGG